MTATAWSRELTTAYLRGENVEQYVRELAQPRVRVATAPSASFDAIKFPQEPRVCTPVAVPPEFMQRTPPPHSAHRRRNSTHRSIGHRGDRLRRPGFERFETVIPLGTLAR